MSEKSGAEKIATTGQVVRGIINIVKGAATGGFAGAAAETAKSFAPQLVKIVCVVLFIALLIFFSLPQVLLSWSDDSGGITTETDRHTSELLSVYQSLTDSQQQRLNQLKEQYPDAAVDGEAVPVLWLIAIDAVRTRQNVSALQPDGIKSLVQYTVTVSQSDTGAVSLHRCTAEEVMEQLGFTDFEKNWARLMVTTVREAQESGAIDPENAGYMNATRPGNYSGYTDDSFNRIITEAEKYLGYPYVYGGSRPATSFDCSGFICWVYTQSGVCNMPRTTAQGIYNMCTPITRAEAKPGDLIFFQDTYDFYETITHVGIYVGENWMLHCGSPIQYASVNTSYWQSHFYGFARPGGV